MASTIPAGLLDTVNRQILRELDRDPRITMSALGRQVGMSAPAVTERVQRLERAGVLTGYRVDISPGPLGLPVTAFVRVRPSAGQLPKIAELAREITLDIRVPSHQRRRLLPGQSPRRCNRRP